MKNDIVIFLIEVYDDSGKKIFILKPKTKGITLVNTIYPIASLMHHSNSVDYSNLFYQDLKAIEYVYIKENNYLNI